MRCHWYCGLQFRSCSCLRSFIQFVGRGKMPERAIVVDPRVLYLLLWAHIFVVVYIGLGSAELIHAILCHLCRRLPS